MPSAPLHTDSQSDVDLDVVIESPLWEKEPRAEDVIREAITVATKDTAPKGSEIAILLTDDSAIRELNRQWRDQDKPTNVLSFPSVAGAGNTHLGDIVISYETLAREAEAENKPFQHHLAHLAIHGYLHLVGYDHMTDIEAEEMEKLETVLLAQIGVPDPYAASEPEA